MTTGQLPPVSDNGKSFVHDPKLESQTSTKAQIRLSFRTDNDSKAVLAVRSFQLTQTKASRQFKALEGVLKVKQLREGTERSVSHKCVDMDKLVPQMMGVSPAVLESVIFCHQSESDWPLSDSKSLKLKSHTQHTITSRVCCLLRLVSDLLPSHCVLLLRFDDIFSATRYTKALDVLHKLKNEKKTSIRVMEAELKTVDTQHAQAKKLKDERDSTEATIAANRDKKQRIDDEAQKLQAELSAHAGKVQEITALKGRIKEKELMISVLEQERLKAYDKMKTEIADSDDQLKAAQAEQQGLSAQLQQRIKEKEERARQLNVGVEENDREYQDNVKAIGKYEQQQAELQQRRHDVAATRDRLIGQYHVEVKGEEEEGREADFLDTMQRVLERQKADLRSHKDMISKVDAGFEESVQGLKTKEVKLSEQLNFRRQNAGKTVARIKELVQRSKEIDASVDKDEHAARTLEAQELERKLNAEEDAGEPGEGQDDARLQMADKQRRLNSTQAELLVLHDERKKFTHQSDALTVIRHRQSQLSTQLLKHNQQLSALLSSHDVVDLSLPPVLPLPSASQPSAALLKKEYDSSVLHGFFSAEHRAVKADLRARQDAHTQEVNAVSRLHGQLKALKDEMDTIGPQVDRIRKAFASPSSSEPDAPAMHLADFKDTVQWDEEVVALQGKLDKSNAEKGRNANTLELLEKYMAKYKEDLQCPMCQRGFDADGGDTFAKRMEETISGVRELVLGDKLEKKATALRRRLKRMQELSPLFHDYVRLNVTQRESIEDKLKATQAELDEAELKAEEQERAVKRLTQREQRLTELISTSADVRRLYLEVVDTVKAVEREREKLRAAGGKDGGRELEQVTRELEEKEKLRSRLQTEVTALQERMNAAMKRREDVTRRYHTLKTTLADVDKLMEEKGKNDREVLKLKAQWQEDKDEADKLTAAHASLKEQVGRQEQEREEQRRKNAEGEAVLQSSVADLQREVDAFSRALEGITAITTEMDSGRSLQSQKELYAKAAKLKSLREERDNGLKELNALKERLATLASELTDIDANIDYRKRQFDIDQLHRDLHALQQQLQALTGDSGALAALAANEKRIERLQAKANEMKGALTQLQKYSDDRAKDLASPLYKDVSTRHAAALIDLQTNLMAVRDLEVYGKCPHSSVTIAFRGCEAVDITVLTFYCVTVCRSGRGVDALPHAEDEGDQRDPARLLADHLPRTGH